MDGRPEPGSVASLLTALSRAPDTRAVGRALLGEVRRLVGAEFLIGVEIESAHPESDQIIDLTLTSGSELRGRSGVIASGVAYRQLNAPGVEHLVGNLR